MWYNKAKRVVAGCRIFTSCFGRQCVLCVSYHCPDQGSHAPFTALKNGEGEGELGDNFSLDSLNAGRLIERAPCHDTNIQVAAAAQMQHVSGADNGVLD